jgi:hypothetical protein
MNNAVFQKILVIPVQTGIHESMAERFVWNDNPVPKERVMEASMCGGRLDSGIRRSDEDMLDIGSLT